MEALWEWEECVVVYEREYAYRNRVSVSFDGCEVDDRTTDTRDRRLTYVSRIWQRIIECKEVLEAIEFCEKSLTLRKDAEPKIAEVGDARKRVGG